MNLSSLCSVIQMRSAFGTITKRGHNCYRLQWHDKSGKRRSKTVHGTRSVAQKELAAIECGLTHIGEQITYDFYWREYVVPTFADLKPKTVYEYKRLWDKYLAPNIGKWRIPDTTWRDIQSVIDTIEAPVTQRRAFALWRKILNLAVRDEFIRSSPCAGGVKFKPRVKREKTMITAADMSEYLKQIQGIKYEPLLLLLLGGGLRLSEACALTWDDIEEWQGFIVVSVSKALVTVDGVPVLQDSTKTAKSRREVVIGEPFARKLIIEKGDHIGGMVIEASPITIAHNYKAWCKVHGLEHTRLGDMRSIYVTLCGEAGCPDSLVSMQLGHADGTTKGEHYQQATRLGKKLVAETLALYLESVQK